MKMQDVGERITVKSGTPIVENGITERSLRKGAKDERNNMQIGYEKLPKSL
jgi:hypothetical protein